MIAPTSITTAKRVLISSLAHLYTAPQRFPPRERCASGASLFLAVLLGANALVIWCEFDDGNICLRSLVTLRKARVVQQENEEDDAPGWQRQQRLRTTFLRLTWPGTSTKQ